MMRLSFAVFLAVFGRGLASLPLECLDDSTNVLSLTTDPLPVSPSGPLYAPPSTNSPTSAPTAPTWSPVTSPPTKVPTTLTPTAKVTNPPTTHAPVQGTSEPTKPPTVAPTPDIPEVAITKAPTVGEPCVCGDKTNDVEGDGFVTGGGWILLTSDAVYRGDPIAAPDNRANFGFNAMFRGGVPRGSTNFVFQSGKYFHFHSTTGGNAQYDFLEIPNGVQARWQGTGKLTEGSGKPKLPSEAQNGYSFYVAVQDWGEPGADDTWRIKIWETNNPSNVIFDSNPSYGILFTDKNRFEGTTLGSITKNGGGNIQLHRKGVTQVLTLPGNKPCNCKETPAQGNGNAFVTGGGWINIGPTAIWNSITGASLVIPEGSRANFGFNAKWKNGVPDGSTNFVFEGGSNFHFHSATGGQAKYDFLEVPSPTDARWCGYGKATVGIDPRPNDFADGYKFCVAVHDFGEPGAEDTWHIKIWYGTTIIFDTNPEYQIAPTLNVPYDFPTGMDRFEGTRLGEEDQNGGGNIQIHWKKTGTFDGV